MVPSAVGVRLAEELHAQLPAHTPGLRAQPHVPDPDRAGETGGEHLAVQLPAGEDAAVVTEDEGDGEGVRRVVTEVGEHGEAVRDARLELHHQGLVHERCHGRAFREVGRAL